MQPITTADQLVARLETSTLDYKTTYDPAAAVGTRRAEMAKDVAMFANAFGGAIVVGAFEAQGRVVRLDGVADPPALLREVAAALQQYCVPVPSTPEEHVIQVSEAQATRILGRAPGNANPITLVALNMRPEVRAPIGVRHVDAAGLAPLAHAYRFPVRIDDRTRFLDPTELPMWMNSHERRIALQLRRLHEAAGGAPVDVLAFHIVEEFHGNLLRSESMSIYPFTKPVSMRLGAVDEEALTLGFTERLDGAGGPVVVPLSFVTAVWREPALGPWCLALRGTLYPRVLEEPRLEQVERGFRVPPSRREPVAFRPYLGGA